MIARWLVVVTAVAGCGRIGYDAAPVDAQGDSAEAGPPPGALMACDQPVQLIDLGDTGGATATTFALDVAATATGFVAAWQTGGAQTHTSGLAFAQDASGPYLANIQSDALAASKEGPIAIAAVGDQVLLAVDDAANVGVKFLPLDAAGYERAGATRIDGYRAFGFDYLAGDPGRGRFVAMLGTGVDSHAVALDVDGNLVDGPDPMFTAMPEALALRPLAGGYAAITGNPSNCDVVVADGALAANATTRQAIPMTCHNASLVVAPDGAAVVAGWNCDDNRVWATGGPPGTMLPMHHEVFGDDADNISSNPRLGVTSAGVWYAFEVGADRYGRALLGPDSQPLPALTPGVVVTAAGRKAHDVATHGDVPFLFWLQVDGTTTSLWAMRMCVP